MKKFIAISCFALFKILDLEAQVSSDILRAGISNQFGTARTAGTAGSIGALGGDFGSIGQNPAGLGSYRKSEFIFSPGYFKSASDTKLDSSINQRYKDSKARINLSNIGIVLTNDNGIHKKWTAFSFAIGLNRIADFREQINYEGLSQGSIVERFQENAKGKESSGLNSYEEFLAWKSGAIFDLDDNLTYESDFDTQINLYNQKIHEITSTGSISELLFGIGGNYKEKLQLGLTLGLPYFTFSEESTYREIDQDEHISIFNNLIFKKSLTTKGAGINGKLGIIYKPIYNLRIGASYHSPTVFQVKDTYNSEFTYDYTTNGTAKSFTNMPESEAEYKYSMISPGKLLGSMALISRVGFLSAEVEYLDYRQSKFTTTDGESSTIDDKEYFKKLNREIDQIYQSVVNLRFGGELAFDIFRVRAGMGLYGKPFANEKGFNPSWSAGAGIREDKFFVDLAFTQTNNSKGILPYQIQGRPRPFATSEIIQSQFILTVGFKL